MEVNALMLFETLFSYPDEWLYLQKQLCWFIVGIYIQMSNRPEQTIWTSQWQQTVKQATTLTGDFTKNVNKIEEHQF